MIKIVKENTYLGEEDKKENKILILTARNEEEPETFLFETVIKLNEELDERKISYYNLFTENAYITNDDGKITVYNVDDKKGFVVTPEDTVIINRNVPSGQLGMLGVMTTLEKNDFVVVNNRICVEVCADKYRSMLRLEENDVQVPKTLLIQDELTLERLLPQIEFPCVVKTLTGSEGVGVFIAESKMNLVSVLQTIWKLNEFTEVIVQEFIESDGDIRAIFIGGEYIAAMKRLKIKDDFRSNFSLGGDTEQYELSDKEIELCKKVVDVMDGEIIGVDFMIGEKGSIFVLEANSSPGTTGISETSKVDVVGKMIDYMMTL